MSTNLVEKPKGELVQAPGHQVTPMDMLNMAVSQNADLDKLEKLMALQERWEANEARKAYVVAMAAFKKNPPDIFKTKAVAFNDVSYKHALLSDATELIGRGLSTHGLSATWETDQGDGGMVRVTCIITHAQGHSERVSLQAGLDQSGKKNNIQALGSTVSYLERYTLFAATGLAAKDQDDDGAGADGVDEPVKAKARRENLPPYPEQKLTENLPIWSKLVASGTKTTDAVIKNIKTKYTLTPAQEQKINDLAKPAAPDPEWVADYEKHQGEK